MIKVNDLIKYLQTLPEDLPIAFQMYSEQCLMELDNINVVELCAHREDGWVQNKRPDKPTMKYLLSPGN